MKRNRQKNNQKKKAELRKLVMQQLKKMRKKMKKEHPDLINNIRKLWENSQKNSQTINKEKVQAGISKKVHTKEMNTYSVDQKKNKEAIEKLLELKCHSPAFQKSVQAMLAAKKQR